MAHSTVLPTLFIDVDRRAVRTGSEIMHPGRRDFELLVALARQPDRALSVDALLDTVWGDTVVVPGMVKLHVASLRKVLGDAPANPRFIQTVRGHGYRFCGRAVFAADDASDTQLTLDSRPGVLVVLDGEITPWCVRLHADVVDALSRFSQFETLDGAADATVERDADYVLRLVGNPIDGSSSCAMRLSIVRSSRVVWSEAVETDARSKVSSKFSITKVAAAIANRIELTEKPARIRNPDERSPASRYCDEGEGIAEVTTPDYLRAQRCYEIAQDLEPKAARPKMLLARSLMRGFSLGIPTGMAFGTMVDRALTLSAEATALDPANAKICATLGDALNFAGEPAVARRSFEQAITLNPHDPQLRMSYAIFLHNTGKAAEALHVQREAIALHPHTPAGWYWILSFCLYHSGHFAQAAQACRVATQTPQYRVASRYTRAAALAMARNQADAERETAVILQAHPDMTLTKRHAWYAAFNSPEEDIDLHLEGLRRAGLPA